MVTILIVLALAILVGDLVYARAGIGLRRRSQPQRPAWDVIRQSREGWRPLDQEREGNDAEDASNGAPDLAKLFRGGR